MKMAFGSCYRAALGQQVLQCRSRASKNFKVSSVTFELQNIEIVKFQQNKSCFSDVSMLI